MTKTMAVVSTEDGKVLSLPAIGANPDAAGYDAKDQLAFSSNGDGTLTVVDAGNAYKVLETLPTQNGGRTMSYDSGTDRVYVVAAEYGTKPDATAANPRPRAPVVPDTFTVLVIGRK